MRVSVPVLLALAVVLTAGVASAQDPAVDAALEADQVNQEHCANLYTAQVDRAASATMAVAQAWQRVDEVYQQTGAVYLLYWRGALAQCLGREEAAEADLTEFVESQGGSTMFASLVQSAKTRLRRLGAGASLGQGAAASWLRLGPALEIELSWSAGSGFHSLACTDAGNGQAENAACLGEPGGRVDARAAVVPAAAQVALDGFLSRGFGLGGRLMADLAVPSGLPVARAPGPTLQIHAGPQMRLLDSVASGGRAGWFRGELRFAVAFTRMTPMAGSAKYAGNLDGYLDPGAWALRHLGAAARLEGAVEVGPGLVLLLTGHYAWYAPRSGLQAEQVIEPSPVVLRSYRNEDARRWEEVRLLPELVSTSQMSAGGRVGLLLPTKSRTIAVGPFVGVDFLRAVMTFPNDEYDCWRMDSRGLCGGAEGSYRKVYSSQRHDLFVTLGIDARFGVEGGE